MKNFQVRLSDKLYNDAKVVATKRETTMADVIRRALEEYARSQA